MVLGVLLHSPICHLHTSYIAPYLPPPPPSPKKLDNLCFFISPRYYSRPNRTWRQWVYKYFLGGGRGGGGKNKVHHGRCASGILLLTSGQLTANQVRDFCYSYDKELNLSFSPSYGLAKHSQVSLTISWLQRICNPISLHLYHSSDLLSHKAFLPCSLQPARFPPSQLHGLFLTCNNQDRINLTRTCDSLLTLVPYIKAKLSQLNNLKSHNSFLIPSQTPSLN